jgi:CNT family concentrative nucleoside transporter
MQNLQSVLGVAALLAIAWILSEDRRAVAWKQTGLGLALGLTLVTALVLIKTPQVTA